MGEGKKKKRFGVPDAFVIIFGILIIASIATYLVPSGQFDREEMDGREIVIEGTYQASEQSPVSVLDIFLAIQNGLIESADLIFMVLIIGGVVAVLEHTGAINSGINSLIEKTNGRKYPLVILFIIIFAFMDMAGISGNAIIAFIPIGIILAKGLNLDPLVGVAMVYLGQYTGVATGTFDPVITGLAQSIAELPLFSGAWLRFSAFVVLLLITIVYICLYVRKISKDPSKKMTEFEDVDELEDSSPKFGKFTNRHKLILVVFFAFLGVFLYGVFQFEWTVNELAAIFLLAAIVVAVIAKINPNEFVSVFIKGAQGMVYGALVIGLARSIVLVLEEGAVLDTIVNYAFQPLNTLPPMLGAITLFFFNFLFNLIITSGTGQAAIVMPFIVPLVDMLDITRQTGVIAFKLGDGITNIITPTSGVLMAVLAVGKVSFVSWFKFVWPLVLMWTVVGVITVAVAVLVNYGPF